jgi:hydrogenase small subunit
MKWDAGLSFPIQSGHPCLGCSQPDFWDGGGFYQGQSAPLGPPGLSRLGIAAGVGALAGAGVAAATRARRKQAPASEPVAASEE